jgi:DNA-binding Lrp family transcriptional regulator
MTTVSENEFLEKLLTVVRKLISIGNTQGSRFKNKWEEYLKPLNAKPHYVRNIKLDKELFLKDIDYRIKILQDVENAFVDGFYVIKSLLEILYTVYFDNSELFKKDFALIDRNILKYQAAREILGNLVQYNKMDHESVPLKYNIIARNYLLMKLQEQGQKDEEILENMEKLQIKNLSLDKIHEIMEEIESDGIISKIEKEGNIYYKLAKELKFTEKGLETYNKTLRPLIEWPTQFWRSFYNIRELNVTIDEEIPFRDFLNTILARTATQGFGPADYVFKNLIKYYEKIKEELP